MAVLRVFESTSDLAAAAALDAAERIRTAMAERGRARIVAATGASQMEFLDRLVREPGIEWPASSCSTSTSTSASRSITRELSEVSSRAADRPGRHHAPTTCSTASAIPSAVCREAGHALLRRSPWTSRSSASARTATWRSTIRRPTSRPTSPTSWCASTSAAGGSRSARAGSRRLADVPETAISMSVRQILEAQLDRLRRAGPAQGGGGARVPRRADRSDDAGVDSAARIRHHDLSRSRVGVPSDSRR